jgi:hypothetical protein
MQQRFAKLVTWHERLRAVQQESLRQAEHLFPPRLRKRRMSDSSKTFGFKRITAENWQDADVPRLFGLTTPDNWIGAHLQPQLSPNVPQEIAALFEVARGSMIYGWFFYPLITLGAEQCYRVLDPL